VGSSEECRSIDRRRNGLNRQEGCSVTRRRSTEEAQCESLIFRRNGLIDSTGTDRNVALQRKSLSVEQVYRSQEPGACTRGPASRSQMEQVCRWSVDRSEERTESIKCSDSETLLREGSKSKNESIPPASIELTPTSNPFPHRASHSSTLPKSAD